MSEHAILAPSSANQWGHCAGSVAAQANIPNPDTEQSREGTAAHWVGSEVLTCYRQGSVVACSAFEGHKAPNGVIIDEKMTEGAQVYVDTVTGQVEALGAKAGADIRQFLLIEHRVFMSVIHPTANWGTLDAALYMPALDTLLIWDYKHGHRDCDVVWNLQLINYLAGLAECFKIDDRALPRVKVTACIVQPFSYHAQGPAKTWEFTLSDLRGAWDKLRAMALEALSDTYCPRLTTGLWCRDCRAVGVCSAARMAGYRFLEVVNAPYGMDGMTGADLAVERDILRDGAAVAKARLQAIEDELMHRVEHGESDSGLALEVGRGHEKWAIPPEQAVLLCGQLGVDATKTAVKTPKQTRDAAPKEVKPLLAAVMAKAVHRPAGKKQLVQASNTKAARAFKPKEERK